MALRHFGFLTPEQTAALFALPPEPFDGHSAPDLLAFSLGAMLYSPGNRPCLADDASRAAAAGTTSQVWCLEDAIAHADVRSAQANVVRNLEALDGGTEMPLLFVRIRTPEQVRELTCQAGPALARLSGFVLPKVRPDIVADYLDALAHASDLAGRTLYALPVLEHPDLAWRESRLQHLRELRALFDRRRSQVLVLRIGGSDLCGLFGLRRDAETTIWDVTVVRDILGDAVNVFGRGGDYVVSGPVWEHFARPDRLLRPWLRATPFQDSGRMPLRQQLLRDDTDELLREVLLDRANGLHGKTVIHPTHVGIVNTLHTVSREEYDDARTILDGRGEGGAIASRAGNKMNERGPHELWADQVLLRARAFGVLAQPDGIVELLERSRAAVDAAFPQS